MGRRRISEPPSNTPPLCRRFEWVLRNEFTNSITVMAAALGVPHATLSRVINHGQPPSAQMIEALARFGRVDLRWLLTGDSDAPPPQVVGACGFLPVSDRLLPGTVDAARGAAGPLGLPVASPYAVGHGYWFCVPKDSPVAAREDEKVAPGDYLLIATGPEWTSRTEAFIGRLVVLRHPLKSEGLLARVGGEDLFADSTEFDLNTFGLFPNATLSTGVPPSSAVPKAGSKPARSSEQVFHAADVVGVVLEKRTVYPRRRV